MKRGTRDTIRRKPDYERDPDWDITEILDGHKKHAKKPAAGQVRRSEEIDADDLERSYVEND